MINLLPYSEKTTVDRMRIARMTTVILAAAIILAALLCLLLVPTITTINSRYALSQDAIVRLENAGVGINAEMLAQSEARAQAVKADFASPETISPTEAIAVMRNVAPAGVALSGFAFASSGAGETLTAQGVVTTRGVLQSYADALRAEGSIATVDNPVTNYLKQYDNDFTITVTFK